MAKVKKPESGKAASRPSVSAAPRFPDAGVFQRAIAALRASQDEQILIERSIGQAVIQKIARKAPSLIDIYQKLGGRDPVVLRIFERINPIVVDLPVDKAVNLDVLGRGLREAINTDLAAGKSHAIAIGNPVFDPPDTALHTLAELGGDQFKRAYKLDF